jgi:hypothetical protein
MRISVVCSLAYVGCTLGALVPDIVSVLVSYEHHLDIPNSSQKEEGLGHVLVASRSTTNVLSQQTLMVRKKVE